MARPVEWINQLRETLGVLTSIDEPVLTTNALATALKTSRRQASRIMRQLGARKEAGNLMIERPRLIDRLNKVANGEPAQFEANRQKRLVRVIVEARKVVRARETVLHPKPTRGFPQAVKVFPGKLEIEYSDAVGLLTTLMELGQSAAEDLDWFKEQVEA